MENNELDNYQSVIQEIVKRRNETPKVDKEIEERKNSKNFLDKKVENEERKVENKKEIEIKKFYEDINEDEKREEEEKEKIEEEKEKTKKIKRSLKEKMKTLDRLNKRDSILFFIYLVLFLIVLLIQINVDLNFKINTAINEYFSITSDEIDSINLFMSNFMDKVFTNHFNISVYYKIVSNIRINQRRLKEMINPDPLILNYSNNIRVIDSINPLSEYNPYNENSDTFKTEFNTYVFNKELSFLQLGGYQIIYDPIDYLNKNYLSYSRQIMTQINQFIDKYTSSITIDFTLVNMEIFYFCPVIFILTKSSTGFIHLQTKIFYIDSTIYNDNYVEILFEGAFCLIVFIYLIFTIYHLKYRVHIECLILKEEERLKKSQTVSNGNQKDLGKEEREFTCLEKFTVFLQIVFYDLSTFVQVFSLVLSFVCIILWVRYSLMALDNSTYMNEFITSRQMTSTLNTQKQDDMIWSGFAYSNYITCVCFNILFTFFKFFKMVIEYFPRAKIFINALREASDDLISFGIFYLISFIGVSIFAFLFYGKNVNQYRVYSDSLFKTINDSFNFFDDQVLIKMYDFSQYVTFLYCISIIIAIRLILLKILLSIILYHYRTALEKYEDKLKQITDFRSLSQKKILKIFPEHFVKTLLTHYINCIHMFFDILTLKICFKSQGKKEEKIIKNEVQQEGIIVLGYDNGGLKKKNVSKSITAFDITKMDDKSKNNPDKSSILIPSNRSINPLIDKKEEEEEEIKMSLIENEENKLGSELESSVEHIKIKDLSEFNIDFVDSLNDVLKDKYFESEKDKSKVSEFYEHKYRKSFKNLLIYMFYISTVIFTYTLTSFSPWHQILLNSVSNLIHSTPSIKNLNLTTVPMFEDIGDLSSARDYVVLNLKNMFELNTNDNNYLYRANKLINNSILLTIRMQEPDNTTFQRKYDDLNLDDKSMQNELRINIAMNSTKMRGLKFSYNNSYREYGGYSFLMGLDTLEKKSMIIPNEILMLSTFITVEFFMENLEYSIISHTEIILMNNFGGLFYKNFITHFTQLSIFQDIYDYILTVIELIFLINFLIHVYYFSKSLYDDILMYTKWYKEQIGKLSLKTISFRQRVRPEFLRFLEYLLDFERILDLIIIVLSIYLIVCKIFLYQNQYTFTMNYEFYKLNFYALSNIISTIDDLYDKYTMIGAILLASLSLKIFKNIEVSEYFSILTKTIKNSAVNNINFIILLILIHPPFIFFSYYAFGYNIYIYNSIFKCIITLFIGFFSLLDNSQINKTNIFLGVVYFFLYTLVVNMLLSNFFVSIISKALTNVKENIRNANQKYSIRRIFCFCFMGKRNKDVNNINSVINEFDYSKKVEINENQIDFSHHNDIEEFCLIELNYLKYVNEIINSLKIKQTQIQLSYVSKKGEGQNFDDNLYCDVDKSHINCFSFFQINAYSKIINKLEDDIELIQFYQDHLDNFNKFQDFVKKKVELQVINEKYLEKILVLEADFISLFSDIEQLQNVNRNYENIINNKIVNQEEIKPDKESEKYFSLGGNEENVDENEVDVNEIHYIKPY